MILIHETNPNFHSVFQQDCQPEIPSELDKPLLKPVEVDQEHCHKMASYICHPVCARNPSGRNST